jgi:hypothetical protein
VIGTRLRHKRGLASVGDLNDKKKTLRGNDFITNVDAVFPWPLLEWPFIREWGLPSRHYLPNSETGILALCFCSPQFWERSWSPNWISSDSMIAFLGVPFLRWLWQVSGYLRGRSIGPPLYRSFLLPTLSERTKSTSSAVPAQVTASHWRN